MAHDAPRRVSAVVASAVAAVALGLLGMHVLLPHGTHGDAVAGHAASAHTAAHVDAEAPVEAPAGETVDAAVLCAVLLLTAAVTGLLLRALGRVPGGWRVARGTASPPTLAARSPRRASGPPPEWAYSVVRC